jgi:PBP1b-binding outer membrane lipoprotein LpoB
MRKMLAMLAIATVVASCSEATEEVVVEETVVDTVATVDSTALEVVAEGEEAAAE